MEFEEDLEFNEKEALTLKKRVSILMLELKYNNDRRFSILANIYYGKLGETSEKIRWYLTSRNREIPKNVGARGEFVASCYASKAVLNYSEMEYPDLYGRLQRAR